MDPLTTAAIINAGSQTVGSVIGGKGSSRAADQSYRAQQEQLDYLKQKDAEAASRQRLLDKQARQDAIYQQQAHQDWIRRIHGEKVPYRPAPMPVDLTDYNGAQYRGGPNNRTLATDAVPPVVSPVPSPVTNPGQAPTLGAMATPWDWGRGDPRKIQKMTTLASLAGRV